MKPWLLKEFADNFPGLLNNDELYWYGVVLPSDGFRTTLYSFDTKDKNSYDWAKENVVQYVIPFPRQSDSLSEYDTKDQDVLLALKTEMYNGVKNKVNKDVLAQVV